MENSIINKREVEQGVKVVLKTLATYNKHLTANKLNHSDKNYIDFINGIPYQYTEDECKEIINLFLVINLEEDNSIVFVDKNDSENVIVFNSDVNWKWSSQDGLAIHIWDKENNININIDNVVEDYDDFNRLDIGKWILDVM